MTTTSGTNSFDLSVDEIIEEACSRVYGNVEITGREALEARRALNLLLIDLANKQIPLGTLEERQVTVTSSVAEYSVSSDVLGVLYGVLSRDSTDTPMKHLSLTDFKAIPRKTQIGRPTQYAVSRTRDNIVIKLWSTPENSTDIFKYWAFTKIEDVTKADQLVDLHQKYLPAIVAGAAWLMAMKKDPTNTEFIGRLKSEYDMFLENATDSDRERSSLFAVPYLSRI